MQLSESFLYKYLLTYVISRNIRNSATPVAELAQDLSILPMAPRAPFTVMRLSLPRSTHANRHYPCFGSQRTPHHADTLLRTLYPHRTPSRLPGPHAPLRCVRVCLDIRLKDRVLYHRKCACVVLVGITTVLSRANRPYAIIREPRASSSLAGFSLHVFTPTTIHRAQTRACTLNHAPIPPDLGPYPMLQAYPRGDVGSHSYQRSIPPHTV